MQIKPTVGDISHLAGVSVKMTNNKHWQGCGEAGTLIHIADGDVVMCKCFGKQFGSFSNFKHGDHMTWQFHS